MHRAAWPPGLHLRFWGVRGGLPAPGPDTLRYGGNTACVEVRCGGRLLILDAGSGLRSLGDALMREQGEAIEAEVLCSHTHLDHICGLPFFAPLYHSGTRLRIWGGKTCVSETLQTVLATTLSDPLMPDLLPRVRAEIEFKEFRPGDVLAPWPGMRVSTAELRHPGGAVGYRLECESQTVAYVTDTEHDPAALNQDVLRLAKDVNILIYDATYTEEEFPLYKDLGTLDLAGRRAAGRRRRGQASCPVPPRPVTHRRRPRQDRDPGSGGSARHDGRPRGDGTRGVTAGARPQPDSASRTNGLLARSRPIVDPGPWPHRNATSSPSGSSLSRIDASSAAVFPYGKSVRPTLP